MSYKNLLQEYYQKQGKPLPLYNTTFESGEAHIPTWMCILKLEDGKKFQAKGPNKKTAEMDAANLAYTFVKNTMMTGLSKDNSSTESDDDNPPDAIRIRYERVSPPIIYIYLDSENQQEGVKEFSSSKIKIDTELYAYATKHSAVHQKLTRENLISKKNIRTTKSTRKDAADIKLTVDVVRERNIDDHIMLISNDHFVDSLKDVLDEDGYKNVKVYKNVKSAIKYISKLVL